MTYFPDRQRRTRALLPFLVVIAIAAGEGRSAAQGALANGDTYTGTIAVPGQTDVWSFSATQGDFIALAIGEIVANPDPGFVPLMQLRNHDTQTIVTQVTGTLAAQIAVTAPLTATYDVLVRDSNISRSGTALGSYKLTLVRTPGALVVHADDEGGAMTNGANHAGSLYIGDLDAWTFTAAQGDYIVLGLGEVLTSEIDPLFNPWIRLIGPTGTLITSASGALAAQVAATAPLTGTYTVLVSDSAISREPSHPGTYILNMVKTNAGLTVPNGDEGGAMTNGANHAGLIGVGDLDGWTFNAAQGDYITLGIGEVLTSEIDPLFQPWIRVLGPNGDLLNSAQGALATQIALNAPLSGLYTVVVSDSAISREPSHTGTYVLTMVKTNAALTVPNGDEGGPMTNGAQHSGVIAVGDLDGWTFNAAQGDYIALSIGEVLTSEIDPLFQPWIRVLGPNGDLLNSAQGALAAQIALNAPLSGLYTVVVSDSAISREPSHAGNYILTMVKTNAALTVPNGDEGGPMTNGANHPGAIYVGDIDGWTFSAAQGDYIALSIGEVLTTEIDPGFVPWIRLIGPTGAIIAQSTGNLAAQISANAPLTGLYTVIVTDSAISREPSHPGNYVVILAKTNLALTVPNGDEGGPMVSGANYPGTIGVGDLDPWTFTAAQGDYIAVKVGEVVLSEIDPLFVPWIRLIGPTGALVAQDTGNLTATIAATATLSGTYTLLVTDSAISREPSHAGSYLLTMFKAPGPLVVPTGDHGGTLPNNVPRAGSIYSGDLDEWTFLATSGHALSLTITEVINGADPGFVPWIRLIGPTGALVAQAAGTLTATINVAAPATGLYTIIVADSDISREGSAIGNYTLTAIGVDPSVCDSGAVAGVTVIRATDVTSLRDRINSVRGRFGLGAFSFTDANLTGMPIKATHFLELRSALHDAYIAAGQTAPTFTDPALAVQQTFIRAVHLNELCSAVAAVE
jgi:hypothetical protein